MRRILAALTVAAAVGVITLTSAGAAANASTPFPSSSVLVSPPATVTPSPSPTGLPDAIALTGVVEQGVEGGCLLLKPDLPNYYPTLLLLGGNRQVLVPGAHVGVVGMMDSKPTACQQGQPFVVLGAYPA